MKNNKSFLLVMTMLCIQDIRYSATYQTLPEILDDAADCSGLPIKNIVKDVFLEIQDDSNAVEQLWRTPKAYQKSRPDKGKRSFQLDVYNAIIGFYGAKQVTNICELYFGI